MNRALFIVLLIACCEAAAQRPASDIVRRYNEFKRAMPGVRLQLVFNQDHYAPGDTAWFKAYFFNDDMSPVKGRQLINLSVISDEGKAIQHFIFVVANGIGHNQVVFPDNTPPGIYTVSAYSEWMKNFSPPPVFAKELMVVNDLAVAINQEATEDDRFDIRISYDSVSATARIFVSSGNSLTRFQPLDLIVTNHNSITSSFTFCEGVRAGITFDVKTVPGISRISVLDKPGRLVATKAFNIPVRSRVKVQVESDNEVFRTREKAELAITLLDESNRPVEGEFSVKVLNGEMFRMPLPSFTEEISTSAMRHVEPWTQILSSETERSFDFKTDLYRKGTALYGDDIPVRVGTTIVFYLQHNDVIMQAQAGPGGRFEMPLPALNGNDELVAFAEFDDESIEGLKVRWDESPVELPVPLHTHEVGDADVYGVFASNKKVIDKSFGFYRSAVGNNLRAQLTNGLEDRLGGVDITVDVQKYVMFSSMSELIKEIIPALSARWSKGKAQVRVTLREPMPVASSDPLYIIDGVVTRDTEYFVSLKAAGVSTVKVVTSPPRLMPLGLIGKNGIVIVETIAGDSRPPSEPWQLVEGIHPSISFAAGTTENTDRLRPDLRSTIFWAPTVRTGSDGKAKVEFYCSDDIGKVRVRIDGFTKDGRPFSGEKDFRVVLK